MSETDETLEQITNKGDALKAIENLSKELVKTTETLFVKFAHLESKIDALKDHFESKIDDLRKDTDTQFEAVNQQLEVVRQGIVSNSARFDQLEALALEAKSIALVTRSQVTILTEEIRQNTKILV